MVLMQSLTISYRENDRLSPRKKRNMKRLGVGLAILGVGGLIFLIIDRSPVSAMFSMLSNIILGFVLYFQGKGHPRLNPRRFVEISDDMLSYKIHHLRKRKDIPMDHIQGISYEKPYLIIADKKSRRVKLSRFPLEAQLQLRSHLEKRHKTRPSPFAFEWNEKTLN